MMDHWITVRSQTSDVKPNIFKSPVIILRKTFKRILQSKMSGLSVSKLIDGIKALPEETKMKMSSVIGAVVADAASLPLQWIYDAKKMKEIVGDKSPEFWPESHCPFYSLATGCVCCYTDEMLTSLASIAASSKVDTGSITKDIETKFGASDSPYQIALAKRSDRKYPIAGPWINGGVIKSLQNMSKEKNPPGSESCEDNDGFTLSLPAYLLGFDEVTTRSVANLVTTNNVAMSHLRVQTLIVQNIIKKVEDPINSAKSSVSAEFPQVAKEIGEVIAAVDSGLTVEQIVAKFGKACSLPGSFQGSLSSILLAPDYVTAVRTNILAGGDCCSRANYIGAVLGAKFGVEAIPMEWIEKVHGIGTVLENVVKIFASSK